jgi:hypothetical protein
MNAITRAARYRRLIPDRALVTAHGSTPGDPPPAGWAFVSGDRRYSGEGRTRADAVIAAYTAR